MVCSRFYNIIMFAAAVLIVTAGCLEPPKPVAFEELTSGQHGPAQAMYEVVTAQQLADPAPDQRWMQHLLPDLSLDNDILLFTTLGQRHTAGYSIAVVDISRRRSTITVTVQAQSPAPDEATAQVMTSPYAITRISPAELGPGNYQVQFRDHRGRSLAIRRLEVE